VKTNSKSWDRVNKLEHGKVYVDVSYLFKKFGFFEIRFILREILQI
jgi:hypothetical protein